MSRRGGEGEKGTEGAPVGKGQGVRSCFTSLFPFPTPTFSSQNPQNKTSPFSVSPTGPSTKVSTYQNSQGRGTRRVSCDDGLASGRGTRIPLWAQGLKGGHGAPMPW